MGFWMGAGSGVGESRGGGDQEDEMDGIEGNTLDGLGVDNDWCILVSKNAEMPRGAPAE